MENFKGTKGKWQIGIVPDYNDTLKSAMLEIQCGNVWICKVQNNGIIENDEGMANSLLISKAPEMLEMLQKMVCDFEQTSKSSSDILMEYLGKAKRLIKSATEL